MSPTTPPRTGANRVAVTYPEPVPYSGSGSSTSRAGRDAIPIPTQSVGQMLAAARAATLNKNARDTEASQLTVGGLNTLIPLLYGEVLVGGKIIAIKVDSSKRLCVSVLWGHGEIQGVVTPYINDLALPSGVSVNHYTGAAGQGIDPFMQNAIGVGVYTDTNAGYAYSVFRIEPHKTTGFPRFTARIQGKKVSILSGGAKTYSTAAAFHIADFIESTVYGMGRAVNWTTVAAMNTINSSTAIGETKRILNLVMDQSLPGEQWMQSLRDYCGCWVVPEGSSYELIPDTTGSSEMTFTADNIVAGSMQISKKGNSNRPTMVEVEYTDTSVVPWRTSRYSTAPVSPRRVTRISIPGITRYSEAVRYATERLNDANLCDLNCSFVALDEGLKLRIGTLVTITHPIGLTAKVMRVVQIDPVSAGRWRIGCSEYQAAKYDNSVATAPGTPDTTMASPADSTQVVTAITVSDAAAPNLSGVFTTKLSASWTPPSSYPFVDSYKVWITKVSGGATVETAIVSDPSYVSGPLDPSIAYYCNVAIITTVGVICATTTSASYTAATLPAVPAAVTGFAANVSTPGTVALTWTAVAGIGQGGYEIRYDGASWAAATYLDRVAAPTTRYESTKIAAGAHTYRIKALDAVRTATYPNGQESAAEATTTGTVVAIDTSNIGNGAGYIPPTGTYYSIPLAASTPIWASYFRCTGADAGYSLQDRTGGSNDHLIYAAGGTVYLAHNSLYGTPIAVTDYQTHQYATLVGGTVIGNGSGSAIDELSINGGSNGANIQFKEAGTTRGYLRGKPGGAGMQFVDSAYSLVPLEILDGGGIEMTERTAPSAGATNTARLFVRDNAGKSELCVIFNTGGVLMIKAQP